MCVCVCVCVRVSVCVRSKIILISSVRINFRRFFFLYKGKQQPSDRS